MPPLSPDTIKHVHSADAALFKRKSYEISEQQEEKPSLGRNSRGSSIIILVSYVLWLVFQTVAHKRMFDKTSEPSKLWNAPLEPGKSHEGLAVTVHGFNLPSKQEEDDDAEEEQIPVLTSWGGGITTVVATVLIGFHSEFATNSIQGLRQRANISQKFVGLVILPILSFDPSAVAVAMKDKMDLSISFTLEKCMQTSLLVVPFVIIIAWGMVIDDMTLEFDGFSTASLFASNLIVSYVVQAGRSNWLTGALLIKIYLIIALAAFFIE
ncbi:hypothetical protein SLS56_009267 [Neofusicoccum ribis]|uniref:Sodium/calcium exchanger membrane region domain-containing protein n=1 Tax=Neofusicoccum ribis TaxID=45134 RepID=A0ABR3SJB7_9PEZI